MPKLYRTDIESDADLKVFVTDIRSEAQLIVFETTSAWEATEGPIWCYTDIRSEADKVGLLHGRPVERRPGDLQDRHPVRRRLGRLRQIRPAVGFFERIW